MAQITDLCVVRWSNVQQVSTDLVLNLFSLPDNHSASSDGKNTPCTDSTLLLDAQKTTLLFHFFLSNSLRMKVAKHKVI